MPGGLFDPALTPTGLFDKSANPGGLFAPELITAAATSGVTVAQEIPVIDQELSGQMVGIVWQ